MNNKIIITIIAILAFGLLIGLSFLNKTEEEISAELPSDQTMSDELMIDLPGAGTYEINPNNSLVVWTGSKTLIANYEDVGTFDIKQGNFTIENETITKGEVIIDTTSLESLETSNTSIGLDRLTNHLKSADFFAVDTYPTATFVLINFDQEAGTITGNLTIKDKTNPISFPVTLIGGSSDGTLTLEAGLSIDRTQFGLTYGSGSFFDNLGDNVIDDMVDLELFIEANKVN